MPEYLLYHFVAKGKGYYQRRISKQWSLICITCWTYNDEWWKKQYRVSVPIEVHARYIQQWEHIIEHQKTWLVLSEKDISRWTRWKALHLKRCPKPDSFQVVSLCEKQSFPKATLTPARLRKSKPQNKVG